MWQNIFHQSVLCERRFSLVLHETVYIYIYYFVIMQQLLSIVDTDIIGSLLNYFEFIFKDIT